MQLNHTRFNNKLKRDDGYMLLLGADIPMRERALVSALRTYPGKVFGMSPEPHRERNRFFDGCVKGNPFAAGSALDGVKALEAAEGLRPDLVVPVLELNIEPAHQIAKAYGLPTQTDQCIALVRDKWAMKRGLIEQGIPTSKCRSVAGLDEIKRAVEDMTFPVVLKPRDFAGSIGAIRVDHRQELEQRYHHTLDNIARTTDTYDFPLHRMLVEEYFEKQAEVSVEVLNNGAARTVLAVTDKSLGPAPYFAEIAQFVPSRESDNEPLKDLALRACEALDITRGIAHVEVMIGPKGDFSVVEVAARPGGDGIMDLVSHVYGYNPYDWHIRTFMDEAVEPPPTQLNGKVAGVCFLKAETGVITAVHGNIEPPEGIRSLYVTGKPGQRSEVAKDYLEREGVAEFLGSHSGFDTAELLAQRERLSKAIFDVRNG